MSRYHSDKTGFPMLTGQAPSSPLKNHEMESFLILAGRCWGEAAELDVNF
ncbi:hypothetical protein [Bradyrhizobium sp. sBnM-33]|nr:hypothetical protein [Bradyrhizobium sp. sBnM-33]WOH52447.1 hypothetical protein RX328_09840 [Bradyrhizobium sp. sBnM-33]